MPNFEYVLTMARYNLWQNESLIAAASTLTDADRAMDRGAFFGSVQRTFSHILWADMIWLSRLADTPAPTGGIDASTELANDWGEFVGRRTQFDRRIVRWAHEVQPDFFEGELTWYSGLLGREITKTRSAAVMHLFNHQTHHRGQIHAMLTAAGARPEATDIPVMPESYLNI